MRIIALTLLLVFVLTAPDTTICPKGFAITKANYCGNTLGPCATTDYDASIPQFATTCKSCFDDASLFTVISTTLSIPVQTCVPNVCTSLFPDSSFYPGLCRACIEGYNLTSNNSCVPNGGIVITPTSSTPTNTTTPTTPANTTNTTTPANTTNSTNNTTPGPANATNGTNSSIPANASTTPTTPSTSLSNTSGVSSSFTSGDLVTSSIILSAGAVICVLMWIVFKLI